MVGPSKILTVSYGTFSCTLEGFDEPFTTMKAIAEYFRDLAADDRYFGAEPPTPDAEMLQRIAEREIQRRVETKISEMGVVLRQTSSDAAVVPLAVVPPAPVPMTAQADAAPAVAEFTAPVAAPAPMVEEKAEPVADRELVAESMPDEGLSEAASTTSAAMEEVAVEEAAALIEVEPHAAAPAPAEAIEDVRAYVPELVADEAYEAALDDIMAEATSVAPDELPEAAAVEEPAAFAYEADEADAEDDSIAAKLMRIRAMVESERGAVLPDFDVEDEIAAPAMTSEPIAADFGFDIDLGNDVPDLRAAEAERAARRTEAAVEAVAQDDIAEMSDDMGFDDEPAIPVEVDDSASLAAAFTDEAAARSADEMLMAQLASMRAAVAEHHAEEERAKKLAADEGAQETAQKPAPEAPYADLAETAEAEEPSPEHMDMPSEPHLSFFQRARARVLRLGRTATHEEAEEAEAAREVDAIADFIEAEPEADFAMADDTPDAGSADAETDVDLSRLMEEARAKLEGAENRRRFSAISHLKAAVAATLADRQLAAPDTPTQPEIDKAEELSLYRDDLSKVVRPRRPTSDAAPTTPRPEIDMRPAPLVLVSEQRIDRQENPQGQSSAIRPRRMAATNLAVFAEDADSDEDEVDLSPESASSFADFAERMGATGLTELLEAAAAYTASVEGHSHFSRPQLLRKVEFVSSRGGYNREDGLRSFGMLLREGKIQKVSPGQFALADGSKFTEEARRATN